MKHVKSLINSVAVFCLLIFVSNMAIAASALYQFSGHIETIEYDDAALISGAGWGIGTDLYYNVIADFDRAGEVTLSDGSTQILQDLEPCPGCNVSSHYFFADLIDGNLLSVPTISTDVIVGARLKETYGSFVSSPTVSQGGLSVWGPNSVLSIFDASRVEDWTVGKTVHVFASASNKDLLPSVFRGTLQLVAISPVPEPSRTSLLLIGGVFIISVASATKRTRVEDA